VDALDPAVTATAVVDHVAILYIVVSVLSKHNRRGHFDTISTCPKLRAFKQNVVVIKVESLDRAALDLMVAIKAAQVELLTF
jgi:hypothetical protein